MTNQQTREAVAGLLKAGFVSYTGGSVEINKSGETALTEIRATRALQERQAFGQFETAIRKDVGPIPDATIIECNNLFRTAVVGIFRRRGVSIANAIFTNQPTSGMICRMFLVSFRVYQPNSMSPMSLLHLSMPRMVF